MEFKKAEQKEQIPTQEKIMENFYKNFSETNKGDVKKISLNQLKELKEKGITTEKFLDYLCQKHSLLLHGSIREKKEGKLRAKHKKFFASNKSAIAIMRSIYSNIGVNLKYSYFLDKNNPLVLKIHTSPKRGFIRKENGFIYVVNNEGFQNKPKGSWQFIKKADEVNFSLVVETEKSDFQYPVEVYNDFDLDKE